MALPEAPINPGTQKGSKSFSQETAGELDPPQPPKALPGIPLGWECGEETLAERAQSTVGAGDIKLDTRNPRS